MVIWAGVDDIMVQPVQAYSFIGDNGHPTDGSKPEKYLFITDAATGEILYIENLIIFVDVQGNVQGKATQGKAADYCEEELPDPMRWARVNIGSTIRLCGFQWRLRDSQQWFFAGYRGVATTGSMVFCHQPGGIQLGVVRYGYTPRSS